MPDPIHTSAPSEVLDSGLVGHERQGSAAERPDANAAKLAELRKANEEKRRSEATNLHIATEGKAPDVKARPREEPASFPRSMRAIASDGNVLRAESWPWKREPTEAERDAFLRSVRGAATVDVVDSKL